MACRGCSERMEMLANAYRTKRLKGVVTVLPTIASHLLASRKVRNISSESQKLSSQEGGAGGKSQSPA